NAGTVRLFGDDGSAGIYRYVVEHTSAGDGVLDLPYGGGINFAAPRRRPPFCMQFTQLRLPERDPRRGPAPFRRKPPAVFIADNAPEFGTSYGYHGYMNCPCPRLVWQPDQPSWDPAAVLPVVPYIQDNYKPEKYFATKTILTLR